MDFKYLTDISSDFIPSPSYSFARRNKKEIEEEREDNRELNIEKISTMSCIHHTNRFSLPCEAWPCNVLEFSLVLPSLERSYHLEAPS